MQGELEDRSGLRCGKYHNSVRARVAGHAPHPCGGARGGVCSFSMITPVQPPEERQMRISRSREEAGAAPAQMQELTQSLPPWTPQLPEWRRGDTLTGRNQVRLSS